MSTVAQLINRAQRQLLSGTPEDRNRLNGAMTATQTTLTFEFDAGKIRKGAVVEVNSELMYVWAVSTSGNTATVERGFNGTTASAHATQSIVTVGPRFPRAQIMEAFNDELDDLSAPYNGLYRIKSVDVSYNGTDDMINLPSNNDVIDLISVMLRYTSDDYINIRRWQLVRNLPTADFSSGTAIRFNELIRSGELRINYKAPFARVSREADDVQLVSGLPVSAEDILILGAQIRLMNPREIKRNFTESQGDTRRANEVPPGAVANSHTSLIRMRRERIAAEATKLDSRYPIYLVRD
jgi:hypothetical protein